MAGSREDQSLANSLMPGVVPVEYAVAVDRYLTAAGLSDGSRRVYKISLTGWSWPLVAERPPSGRARRGAVPPMVSLAVLDSGHAAERIAAAVAERERAAGPRTVNRELSALRGAIAWWQDRGWIRADPTAGLRHRTGMPQALPPLTAEQIAVLWQCGAGLREQALWRLLRDCGAAAPDVLALDAADLDLARGRVRASARLRSRGAPSPAGHESSACGPAGHESSACGPAGHGSSACGPSAYGSSGYGSSAYGPSGYGTATAEMLGWLLAGRRHGPVFRTDRRAAAGTDPADVCPLTGRARMSYRRAAEIFTDWSRPLDPAGRGWTLHQLRRRGPSGSGLPPR